LDGSVVVVAMTMSFILSEGLGTESVMGDGAEVRLFHHAATPTMDETDIGICSWDVLDNAGFSICCVGSETWR
jgi:hypothetical protein